MTHNVYVQFAGQTEANLLNSEPFTSYDRAERYAHQTAYTIACIEGGNYENLPGKAHHISAKTGKVDITYTVVSN
jgi:hypothetical protein